MKVGTVSPRLSPLDVAMSLYESNDWSADSEKQIKLKDPSAFSYAFEDESAVAPLAATDSPATSVDLGGLLDPKFELSVDLQQLLAADTPTSAAPPGQLFPDLLNIADGTGSLGSFADVATGSTDPQEFQNGATTSTTPAGLGDQLSLLEQQLLQTTFNQQPSSSVELNTPLLEQKTDITNITDQFDSFDPSSSSARVVTIKQEKIVQMPQIVQIELPAAAAVPEIDHDDATPGHQQLVVDGAINDNTAGLQTIDLSAAIDAGATLLELPISTQLDLPSTSSGVAQEAVTSTSAKRGRRSDNIGKAKPPSKKRYIQKDTNEYRERRERNNIAVRKSRDKAKRKQTETNARVQILTDRNEELQKKVDLLTKELNVLKGLFTNIGASLPPELKTYFIKQEQ